MLSTTSSSSVHFLRQGSYLLPCAFSQATLAGIDCVSVQFPLWKKWGGNTVRKEIFHKGRRVCLVHVAARVQYLAHSRCSTNACWIKEGMKEGRGPVTGIETQEWALETGMLCPELLAARVWPPNSEFVKNYSLPKGWLSCRHPGKGADLGGDCHSLAFLLGSPLLWHYSPVGSWWVVLLGDGISFPFPVSSFPNLFTARFSVGIFRSAVHFLRPTPSPQGRQDAGRVDKWVGVLAGSQSCYIRVYRKDSEACQSQVEIMGTENILCWVFDLANFIFSGKKLLKYM